MTHTTDAELLPCPFCGAAPKIEGQGAVRWIKCPDDSACGSGKMAIGIPADDLARGIASWNRRAPVAQVPLHKPTIDEVAEAVGYHDSAWDCVDPSELIDAILMLAAAPQPPDAFQTADGLMSEILTSKTIAAQVQLPDCAGIYTAEPDEFDDGNCVTWRGGMSPARGTKIYTEQQVRHLLAEIK